MEKQKVNPKYVKSKLILKPTYKGIAFAWNYMDAQDILKRVKNPTIDEYLQHIKELPLGPCSDQFHNLACTFLYSHAWASDEWIDAEANNIVKESFRKGLLDSIQEDPNYDPRNLLSNKIKKRLMKTYSSKELKELKQNLIKTRNNIESTVNAFPV